MPALDFGVRKFEVTRQAQIVFFALLVTLLVNIGVYLFSPMTIGVLPYVITVIIMLAYIALAVYAVNCYVVGKCVMFSWFVVAVILLSCAVGVASNIAVVMYGKPLVKDTFVSDTASSLQAAKIASRVSSSGKKR